MRLVHWLASNGIALAAMMVALLATVRFMDRWFAKNKVEPSPKEELET